MAYHQDMLRFLAIPLTLLAVSTPLATAAPPTCTARTTGVAVGDSTLWMAAQNYGQKRTLQAALGGSGARVDGKVGRQFADGIDAMRRALGARPCAAVIALGTNGPVRPEQWTQMMGLLSRVPRVVVVNTYTRDHRTRRDGQAQFWMETLNRDIARLPATYRNVRVVDWHRVAAANRALLEPDGVHPSATGSKRYAAMIIGALRSN